MTHQSTTTELFELTYKDNKDDSWDFKTGKRRTEGETGQTEMKLVRGTDALHRWDEEQENNLGNNDVNVEPLNPPQG
ncbi:hypothetical protein EYF80_039915 [Liparis tanakae]|uniref:Uncharacterized protein n=1 Tax=Liparis tanakae TaxID=230148 RepID=A0A4Z2GAA2_9TELE|nr:hypothetical protein EYF80_039915 [Liparis tanakae]